MDAHAMTLGKTVEHGGSLAAAAALFPGAPAPWIDLSTGVNPHAYPLPALPPAAFRRLPEPADVARLEALAAAVYRAPDAACVVAAPGTQALLPLVAALVAPGRAAVLSPTYAEHARAAALAGHDVRAVSDPAALSGAALAVVVNPNNPDGRVVPRSMLEALDAGLVVVDEAFAEAAVAPDESVAGAAARRPLVVLRSFGKFYGLAGVRLGFAVAAPATAARLRERLGPWAVSGPALAAGLAALADDGWRTATRARLAADAARLDGILEAAGLGPPAGTLLFRTVRSPRAAATFARLGRAGIFARRFGDDPQRLRVGIPGDDAAWARLAGALA